MRDKTKYVAVQRNSNISKNKDRGRTEQSRKRKKGVPASGKERGDQKERLAVLRKMPFGGKGLKDLNPKGVLVQKTEKKEG